MWTPQPHISLSTVIPVCFPGEREADMTLICTGTIRCAGKCFWWLSSHFLTRLSCIDLDELVSGISAGTAAWARRNLEPENMCGQPAANMPGAHPAQKLIYG